MWVQRMQPRLIAFWSQRVCGPCFWRPDCCLQSASPWAWVIVIIFQAAYSHRRQGFVEFQRHFVTHQSWPCLALIWSCCIKFDGLFPGSLASNPSIAINQVLEVDKSLPQVDTIQILNPIFLVYYLCNESNSNIFPKKSGQAYYYCFNHLLLNTTQK